MAYRIEDEATEFPLRNEIYQSNPLINARKSFDLMGMRIFILGLRGLNPHFSKKDRFFDEEFKETFIPAIELTKLFQNTKYLSEMKEACRKLFNTTIEIKNSAGEMTLTHIFKKLEYESSKGLRLKFDDEMRPYILNLAESGGYTMIKADYLFKLSSPYAVRILELLLQYQNLKQFRSLKEIRRKFTFENLRYLLNVPENAYKNRPDNFKKYVLDNPIREIIERTPYKVHYKVIKTGRRVYAFEITLDTFDAPVEILNGQRTYFSNDAITILCRMGFSEKIAQALYLKCKDVHDCLSRINRAKAILDRQKKPVLNRLGFLRKAIEEDWQINVTRSPSQYYSNSPAPRRTKSLFKDETKDIMNISDILDQTPFGVSANAFQENNNMANMQPIEYNDDPIAPNKEEEVNPKTEKQSHHNEETTWQNPTFDFKSTDDIEDDTEDDTDINIEYTHAFDFDFKSTDEVENSFDIESADVGSYQEYSKRKQLSKEPAFKAAHSAHKEACVTLYTAIEAIHQTTHDLVTRDFEFRKNNHSSMPLTDKEKKDLDSIIEFVYNIIPIMVTFLKNYNEFKANLKKERTYIVQILESMKTSRNLALELLGLTKVESEKEKTERIKSAIKILKKFLSSNMDDKDLIKILALYKKEPDTSTPDTKGFSSLKNLFGNANSSVTSETKEVPIISFYDSYSINPDVYSLSTAEDFKTLKEFFWNLPEFYSKNPTPFEEYLLALAKEAQRNITWTFRKQPSIMPSAVLEPKDIHLQLAIIYYKRFPKDNVPVGIKFDTKNDTVSFNNFFCNKCKDAT